MARVKEPIKEEWETDKKPDFLTLVKKENDSGIVRAKRLKPKRRKRGMPRNEPSSRNSTTVVGIKKIRDEIK